MSEARELVPPRPPGADAAADLLDQYGCGPIRFSGHHDALYERHLLFDDITDPSAAGGRERFEAAARSVRDVLSQRWVETERTYNRVNPKRIYYLSMEFLIGRSLSNNVNNLRLDRFVQRAVRQKGLDWPHLLEREPDAGLGNGGLGRLAGLLSRLDGDNAAAGDGRWAMGCATNTACSSKRSKTAGSANARTTGCAGTTRGRFFVRTKRSKSSSAAR